MRRFSIGIDIERDSIRVVIADIRTGAFAADVHVPHNTELPSACRSVIRDAGIEIEHVVGIGIAHCRDVEPPGNLTLDGLATAEPVNRAYALLPAAGIASPSTVLMFAGSMNVHLMNSRIDAPVPGVALPVTPAVLPEYVTYELATTNTPDPQDRACTELAAFQLRSVCEQMREAGVPVRRFVVSREIFDSCPQMLQIYASVLDARIKPAAEQQSVALGAAILGCIAAPGSLSGYSSFSQIIHAMAPRRKDLMYRPDLLARKQYEKDYAQFLRRRDNI